MPLCSSDVHDSLEDYGTGTHRVRDMEDKDVSEVLRLLGLKQDPQYGDGDASQVPFTRDEVIPRLINITLQCLGALRALVVEQEKMRIAKDCNDIDGTFRDDGAPARLQRELFRGTHTQAQKKSLRLLFCYRRFARR
jgi:hypothetical protein